MIAGQFDGPGAIEGLARRRRRAEAAAARAYRLLLDAVLEQADTGANVRELARRAGIAHGTIYNELERRRRAQDGQA